MNCEQVFQHLTRCGGAESANGEMSRHLAGCPSCRELADLFRPAVELFDAPSSKDGPEEAPEAWQRVWEAVSVAERAATQLKDRPRPVRGWRAPAGSLARAAALLLVGVLLGGVITRAGVLGRSTTPDENRSASLSALISSDGHATGRCDLLLTKFVHSAENGSCPTCKRRLDSPPSQALALCMVCHTTPEP